MPLVTNIHYVIDKRNGHCGQYRRWL